MVNDCSVVDKLRTYRIFGLAILDWVVSFFGGWLIGYYLLNLSSIIHWILWFILWVIIGIVVHVMVKVPTTLGYYLGLNKKVEEKTCI
jgi:hypothetical protein